jgi:hypothetical protein
MSANESQEAPRNLVNNDIVRLGNATAVAITGPRSLGWAAALTIQTPAHLCRPIDFSYEIRNESGQPAWLKFSPIYLTFHGIDLASRRPLPERIQPAESFNDTGGATLFPPGEAAFRTGDLRERFAFPGRGKFRIWAEGAPLDLRSGTRAFGTIHTPLRLTSNKFDVLITD